GEAAGMQAEESSGPFGLPLLRQGTATAALDSIESGGAHPLESGRIDQHVEWIFDPLMDDTALVDLIHATRRSIDQMDVRQIERPQVFVVEGWPLTAIWVVRLQCSCSLRVLHDCIHARPDLLHEAKAGIQLFLHQLFARQLTVVLFALL